MTKNQALLLWRFIIRASFGVPPLGGTAQSRVNAELRKATSLHGIDGLTIQRFND
jgi:hypothetical protein